MTKCFNILDDQVQTQLCIATASPAQRHAKEQLSASSTLRPEVVWAKNFMFLGAADCGPGSVVGIATGYGLDGPGIESRWGRDFSAPVQTGPGAHTASCTVGTRSFPGVKNGRGVTLTPHPLLVPWSRKSRAIPLLPLWAVRPVQSLSACTRVHFSFYFF